MAENNRLTRNDYKKYAKLCFISFLCALPLIIAADIFIEPHISFWLLIFINVVFISIAIIIGFIIGARRARTIKLKREAYLKMKEEERKGSKNNK